MIDATLNLKVLELFRFNMNHLSLRSFRILFVIKRQLVLVLFYNLTQSANTGELIIVL